MTKWRTSHWQILSVLLLASCSPGAQDPDDSVTTKLPRIAIRPVRHEGSPSLHDRAIDDQPRDSSQAAAAPIKTDTLAHSDYTSLEAGPCNQVAQTTANTGSSPRTCKGSAGFALETSEAEGGRHLAIIAPGGRRSELDLSAVSATGTLGKVAEWRGESTGRPRTLIFRIGAADKPATGRLIVARLDEPACIVAVVPPGPGQNDKARAVADRKTLTCSAR